MRRSDQRREAVRERAEVEGRIWADHRRARERRTCRGRRVEGRRKGKACLGLVERAGQHVLGVAAQRVADAGAWRRRPEQHCAPGLLHYDLLPAEPSRIVRVAIDGRLGTGGGQSGGEEDLESHRLQPTLATREGHRLVADRQGKPLYADLQNEPPSQLPSSPREVTRVVGNALLFLEGGDLGVVDDVKDVDPIAVDLDLTEPVDGEVAQWMGEGRYRSHQGETEGTEQREEAAARPHAFAPKDASVCRATGAQRSEK